MTQASSSVASVRSRHWVRPPFIRSRWLRRGLLLGAVIYLILAVGSLELNWDRMSQGLGRQRVREREPRALVGRHPGGRLRQPLG